jgi:hypothetical protein
MVITIVKIDMPPTEDTGLNPTLQLESSRAPSERWPTWNAIIGCFGRWSDSSVCGRFYAFHQAVTF